MHFWFHKSPVPTESRAALLTFTALSFLISHLDILKASLQLQYSTNSSLINIMFMSSRGTKSSPWKPNIEDNTKDILEARNEDAHQRTQICTLWLHRKDITSYSMLSWVLQKPFLAPHWTHHQQMRGSSEDRKWSKVCQGLGFCSLWLWAFFNQPQLAPDLKMLQRHVCYRSTTLRI